MTDAADKLYGGGDATQPAPAAKPAQDPPPSKAEADATPALAAEFEPSDDPGDTLYGSPESLRAIYEPAIADSLGKLYDVAGATEPAQRQEMLRNHAEVFADARLPPQEAAKLHSLMVSTLRQGPIDEAMLSQWTEQSMTQLRERYGESATAKLEAARQFVRNRPELAAIMRSGLGSHPEIVLALAANAHNLRMKPRARKK